MQLAQVIDVEVVHHLLVVCSDADVLRESVSRRRVESGYGEAVGSERARFPGVRRGRACFHSRVPRERDGRSTSGQWPQQI
jgi:hypothetical protein